MLDNGTFRRGFDYRYLVFDSNRYKSYIGC